MQASFSHNTKVAIAQMQVQMWTHLYLVFGIPVGCDLIQALSKRFRKENLSPLTGLIQTGLCVLIVMGNSRLSNTARFLDSIVRVVLFDRVSTCNALEFEETNWTLKCLLTASLSSNFPCSICMVLKSLTCASRNLSSSCIWVLDTKEHAE